MSRGRRLETDCDFLTAADAFISLAKEKQEQPLTYRGEPVIALDTLVETFHVKPRTFMRYAEAGLLEIYAARTGNLKFVTQESFDRFVDRNFILVGKRRHISENEDLSIT